jgi:hypothetical protein
MEKGDIASRDAGSRTSVGCKDKRYLYIFPPYIHLLLGEGEWGNFWDESEIALRFQIIQHHNTDSTSTDKHGGMASSYNVGSHRIRKRTKKGCYIIYFPLSVLNFSILFKACVCEMTHSRLREQLFHDLLLAAQKWGVQRKTKPMIIPFCLL